MTDDGWWSVLATRASQAWDWFDKRQIDAQVVAGLVMYATFKITFWAMAFAETSTRPGFEVAAIIGAVMVPWSALQGAVVKFHFDTRE